MIQTLRSRKAVTAGGPGHRARGLFPREVAHLVDCGTARLIDVRRADEFARCSIAGADNIAPERLRPADLAGGQLLAVLYCGDGERSADVASELRAHGCEGVTHLEGGLQAWVGEGLCTVTRQPKA